MAEVERWRQEHGLWRRRLTSSPSLTPSSATSTRTRPGSNCTPIGVEFGFNCVEWCCEFVSVVYARAGVPLFHTASVADSIAQAQAGNNGMLWLPASATIQAADIANFDFGGHGNPADFHDSIVRDPMTQANFQTDGGNESNQVPPARRRPDLRDRLHPSGLTGGGGGGGATGPGPGHRLLRAHGGPADRLLCRLLRVPVHRPGHGVAEQAEAARGRAVRAPSRTPRSRATGSPRAARPRSRTSRRPSPSRSRAPSRARSSRASPMAPPGGACGRSRRATPSPATPPSARTTNCSTRSGTDGGRAQVPRRRQQLPPVDHLHEWRVPPVHVQDGVPPAQVGDPGQFIPIGSAPSGTHNTSMPGSTA
jgi:hypothetical protein